MLQQTFSHNLRLFFLFCHPDRRNEGKRGRERDIRAVENVGYDDILKSFRSAKDVKD
jgi:hypothetical protein